MQYKYDWRFKLFNPHISYTITDKQIIVSVWLEIVWNKDVLISKCCIQMYICRIRKILTFIFLCPAITTIYKRTMRPINQNQLPTTINKNFQFLAQISHQTFTTRKDIGFFVCWKRPNWKTHRPRLLRWIRYPRIKA